MHDRVHRRALYGDVVGQAVRPDRAVVGRRDAYAVEAGDICRRAFLRRASGPQWTYAVPFVQPRPAPCTADVLARGSGPGRRVAQAASGSCATPHVLGCAPRPVVHSRHRRAATLADRYRRGHWLSNAMRFLRTAEGRNCLLWRCLAEVAAGRNRSAPGWHLVHGGVEDLPD